MDHNSYNEILELFLKAVESVKSSNSDAYTEDAKKGLVPVGISNQKRRSRYSSEKTTCLNGSRIYPSRGSSPVKSA